MTLKFENYYDFFKRSKNYRFLSFALKWANHRSCLMLPGAQTLVEQPLLLDWLTIVCTANSGSNKTKSTEESNLSKQFGALVKWQRQNWQAQTRLGLEFKII